jgi:uncharacterized protein (DUF433 family)
MVREYVEEREGAYYVAGTRVTLDSIVYSYLRGESAEGIVESYPALIVEQVFGALAFYLANRESIDRYLERERAEFAHMREEARRRDPVLYSKLQAVRNQAQAPRQ